MKLANMIIDSVSVSSDGRVLRVLDTVSYTHLTLPTILRV